MKTPAFVAGGKRGSRPLIIGKVRTVGNHSYRTNAVSPFAGADVAIILTYWFGQLGIAASAHTRQA